MLKKYIISFCVFICHSISAMEPSDVFLNLCKHGNTSQLATFLTNPNNDHFDINCQNETGATGLVCAAKNEIWDTATYLLKNSAIDKMISDKNGDTLFSLAISNCTPEEYDILSDLYTSQEIYELGASLPIDLKSIPNPAKQQFLLNIKNALEKNISVNKIVDEDQTTALHLACTYKIVPLIWQLSCTGASFETKNSEGKTPFDCLFNVNHHFYTARFFVLRELFIHALENYNPKNINFIPLLPIFSELESLLSKDVVDYIKTLYINTLQLKSYDHLKKQLPFVWGPILTDITKEITKKDLLHLKNVNLENLSEQSIADLKKLSKFELELRKNAFLHWMNED